MVKKRRVFISHIHEEGEIAVALKALIESAFLGIVDAFVSSSPMSIKAGKKWLNEVTSALKECSVEVILASPEAVSRPWINFEAGCGWIRDVPVIPLCHSGMTKNKLPVPLNELQAVSATSPEEIRRIFAAIADAISCDLPSFDPAEFIAAVRSFESTTAESKAMSAASPVAPMDGLQQYEFATLAEIAGLVETPQNTASIYQVRERVTGAGFKTIAVTLALKLLSRRGLIEITEEEDYGNQTYMAARLTDMGWEWLETHRHFLDLVDSNNPEPPNDDDEVPF